MKKNISWAIDSWKNYTIKHIPNYSDLNLLNETVNKLKMDDKDRKRYV